MARDTEVWKRANGFDFTPQTLVDMTVEEIMEKAGVHKRKAYEIRKDATAVVASSGANPSLAKEILGILKNGPVNDVQALREALVFKDHHASPHDITKAVWSLQKRALVTFYERKAGRDSIISKIKLTPRGLGEMGILPDRDDTRPSSVKGSKELKRRSAVGRDMTDEENHGAVAIGGPVDVVNAGVPFSRFEQEIISAPPYRAPEVPEVRYAAPPPPAQNEKPEAPVDPLDGYIAIKDVLARKAQAVKLEAAAEALLEAGEEEMANEILVKISFTNLEKEIIRYVAATNRD